MPEYLAIDGPDGPKLVQITDAALSEHGREAAIAAALTQTDPPAAPSPADPEEID